MEERFPMPIVSITRWAQKASAMAGDRKANAPFGDYETPRYRCLISSEASSAAGVPSQTICPLLIT